MTSHVHEFEAREGGRFRISLTYDVPTGTGKTTAHADTYHGFFKKLAPDEQVVEVVEFETADAALRGAITITTTLTDADDVATRIRGRDTRVCVGMQVACPCPTPIRTGGNDAGST